MHSHGLAELYLLPNPLHPSPSPVFKAEFKYNGNGSSFKSD